MTIKHVKCRLAMMASLALAALMLQACGSKGDDATDTVSVGILQYAEHTALTDAREGFLEELKAAGYVEGENLTVTVKNAQGDQSQLQTMSEQLAGENDVNLGIATPAAQSLLAVDSETPSLFTAVYDPVTAKLVESLDEPGGTMTGASHASSVAARLDLLLQVIPKAKKIGVFYASSEVNAEIQAKEAVALLEEKGIEVVVKTISNSNEVQTSIESLASQVDGIYLPTDNIVASTAPVVGAVLKEKKVPAVASDNGMNAAALISYGVDFRELGRQTGKLAVQILEGKDPSTLPVQHPSKLSLKINEEMADALGFDLSMLENLDLP